LVFGLAAAIFALLLIATGIAKLRSPQDTAVALSMMGFPKLNAIGWGIGAIEIAVGALVLITMNAVALAIQTLLYVGFTVWITVALLRKVPIASCGCLGTPDTPPYWGHLVVDSLAAGVSLAALLSGPAVYPEGLLGATALVLVVGLASYLCWVIIGDGARLHGAAHP
jgi:hypothetical protein